MKTLGIASKLADLCRRGRNMESLDTLKMEEARLYPVNNGKAGHEEFFCSMRE